MEVSRVVQVGCIKFQGIKLGFKWLEGVTVVSKCFKEVNGVSTGFEAFTIRFDWISRA